MTSLIISNIITCNYAKFQITFPNIKHSEPKFFITKLKITTDSNEMDSIFDDFR